MRSKKALYNSISFFILEIISIICGFVIPRLILSSFGSAYNGLLTSIAQFLSIVTLLRAGVGGVTRAALFKPIAENNGKEISSIVNATEIFMRKIALAFSVALFTFAMIYPFFVKENFDWFFTFSLVLTMGITTFVQYYFTIAYQMLLVADQRQYVLALIQSISLIFNLIVTVIMVHLNFGVHEIKLVGAFVYCVNPCLVLLYIHKKYKINKKIKANFSPLKQRWDAFVHQLAGYIQENADIMVLTLLRDIKEVSIYAVYYLISNGVKKLLAAFTTGMEAAFGNMVALNDYLGLSRNVKRIEFIVYSIATIAYSCLLLLILPFVSIYTSGVHDVDYIQPLFAVLLTASQFMYCIRAPYQSVVEATGHFRQTRNGAILEAVLNLGINIILTARFGLVGVATGTLVSTGFRTVQLTIYISSKILQRSDFYFVKRWVLSVTEFGVIYLIVSKFIDYSVKNYVTWLIYALIIGIISIMVVVAFSIVFDKENLKDCSSKILSMLK